LLATFVENNMSAPGAPPVCFGVRARRWHLSVVCLAALGALAASGCRRAGPPTPVVPAVLPNTPEGKLEGVMRRLRSALEAAQAPAGSGVVSQRTSSHRLIKPADGSSDYKAEITIYTKVAVEDPQKEKDKEPNGRNAASGDKAAASGKADIPSAGEEMKPMVKKETFDLLYEGDHWKLAEPPKGEIERLCLDYALKDQ
jgi:hypothetical protein